MPTLRRKAFLALTGSILLLSACGDDGRIGTAATALVSRSVISVPGSVPPPNPRSGTATAAELNRASAIVYQRSDVGDQAVEKALLLVPGFLAGAGGFDYLARRVVERSNGRAAVWAIDRRANALEDLSGVDAAESAADPDVAKGYYFGGAEVGGRRFAGFLTANGTDISYLSEWGMKTHVEDIDALVGEARRRYPRAAVFLGGHSLGASIAPIYAAWRFAQHAGFERLSGIVLLEGAPNPGAASPTQEQYETSGISSGIGSASLASLRAGDPTASIPFVERSLFAAAEIVAMRASRRLGDPHGISPDQDIFGGFSRLIFGLTELPEVTNRAALGFGFDDDFQPLSFIRASLGETDGPVGPNLSLVAQILRANTLAPTDPHATYGWRSRAEQSEPDATDIDTFAEVVFSGPSNLIEWYFPARLTLDASVTGGLDVAATGDWRNELYGLAATENARVDVPVFALGGSTGLVTSTDRFLAYRESIAPTLRNGTSRAGTETGFRAAIASGFAHVDPLTADDSGNGNGVFQPLIDWLDAAARIAPRN